MPAQALYLKWRSQTFEQIVGQEHVTQTLRHAIERDKISHAYLFCGPRGTGKTSTARILAKAVNCLSETTAKPCNQCAICRAINDGALLDLIEIDAASNTSVDDVRELRDKIAFRPGQARFKVYIIDEVHMLSTSAFNALLKTLEEPPPHVIFVLATTDPQRIPATVISRCQRFDFRFVPTPLIAGHLRAIADAEGMRVEQGALDLIAAHAGGAVRDAVTLLDQLTAYSDVGITVAHVQAVLGTGEAGLLGDFVQAMVERDLPAGLALIDRLVDQGVQLRQFNADLLDYLRGMLLSKAGGDPRLLHLSPDARRRLLEQAGAVELSDLLRYARLFSESAQGLRSSLQPQLPLELAFLEAAGATPTARPAAAPLPGPRPVSQTTVESKPAGPAPVAEPAKETPVPATSVSVAASGSVTLEDVRQRWPEVMRQLKPVDMHAQAFLNSAQPVAVEAGVVILAFRNPFNRDNFEKRGCGAAVSDVLSKVLGQPLSVQCRLEGKEPALAPKKPASAPPLVRETPPATGGSEDPLVAMARQAGGQVKRVVSRRAADDEPPLPDEPPPWGE